MQPTPSTQLNGSASYLFIKSDYKVFKINIDDIFYLESLRDYVILHTAEGKIKTLQSLRSIEERLPDDRFVRIHKSFVISINKIKFIERGTVFINSSHLPISRTYRENFQNSLGI